MCPICLDVQSQTIIQLVRTIHHFFRWIFRWRSMDWNRHLTALGFVSKVRDWLVGKQWMLWVSKQGRFGSCQTNHKLGANWPSSSKCRATNYSVRVVGFIGWTLPGSWHWEANPKCCTEDCAAVECPGQGWSLGSHREPWGLAVCGRMNLEGCHSLQFSNPSTFTIKERPFTSSLLFGAFGVSKHSAQTIVIFFPTMWCSTNLQFDQAKRADVALEVWEAFWWETGSSESKTFFWGARSNIHLPKILWTVAEMIHSSTLNHLQYITNMWTYCRLHLVFFFFFSASFHCWTPKDGRCQAMAFRRAAGWMSKPGICIEAIFLEKHKIRSNNLN